MIKDTGESKTKKENLLSGKQVMPDSLLDCSPFSNDGHDVSSVVSARGTEEGLILRIDGKADWNLIVEELDLFLGGKKRFFEGGEVSVEWLERLPTKEQSLELENYLKNNFGINIVQRKRKLARFIKSVSNMATNNQSSNDLSSYTSGDSSKGISLNLFDDEKDNYNSASESLLERVERLASGEENYRQSTEQHMRNGITQEGPISFASGSDIESRGVYSERVAQFFGSDLLLDEEANARIIFGTLRSGQRVETPFTLIVVGDVNPGADLIAGGDVIVLGSLRGTAHAGAYEDDLIDRAIIALQMQPMQLRIGSVVSRGSKDVGKTPEMARIDNRSIVVEQFSSKILASRKGK